MENKFYVYLYLDPNNYEVFYVGKGSKNRWKPSIHLNKNNGNNIDLINKIMLIGCENILIKIINCNSEYESFKKEIQIIKDLGRLDLKNGTLINKTNGGEGQSGLKHSEKTKIKMSQSRKGKKQSIKHIINKTKSLKGKTRNIKQKINIRNNTPSKLNFNIAENIRYEYIKNKHTQRKLAKIYKVSQTNISDIINNKIWRKYEDGRL